MSGIDNHVTIIHSNDYFEDKLAHIIIARNGLKKVWRWFQEENRNYSMKGIVGNYSSSLRICKNEMYGIFGPVLRNELEFSLGNIMEHEDTYWSDYEEVLLVESLTHYNQWRFNSQINYINILFIFGDSLWCLFRFFTQFFILVVSSIHHLWSFYYVIFRKYSREVGYLPLILHPYFK